MAKETLVVEGYADLIKGLRGYDRKFKAKARQAFRNVGEHVRADAASTAAPVNTKTAAGYKVAVKQRGVEVYQSVQKTTGRHPEYGAFQMIHILRPAQIRKAPEAEREIEQALDTLTAQFNSGSIL